MTAREIAELLDTTRLFAGIEGVESAVEEFPPQSVLLTAGDRYEIKNSLALFVSGRADIVKESAGGSAYMKTVSDTALLGLATLFSKEGEYISTLVAKSNTELLMFSEEFVSALIVRNSEFSLRLVSLLCQKVRYLNRRIDFYTCSGAEKKVHEFLIRSRDSEGKVVMSMSKLSETLGIARASLYRAIASLEEKGYIIKDGKKIILLRG